MVKAANLPRSIAGYPLDDAFDTHVNFTTSETVIVEILDTYDYINYTQGRHYNVTYETEGTNFDFWWTGSEGCAGYTLLIRQPKSKQFIIQPRIYVKFNPTSYLTGICGNYADD